MDVDERAPSVSPVLPSGRPDVRREVRRTQGTPEEAAARAGVQAAEVALGERGTPPWWEQAAEQRRAMASGDIRTKVATRAANHGLSLHERNGV
jgi:hypothetical protein